MSDLGYRYLYSMFNYDWSSVKCAIIKKMPRVGLCWWKKRLFGDSESSQHRSTLSHILQHSASFLNYRDLHM
uniref:Ovule protein n=1 Tax=Steinernema glaseri TaxID=37863 RepID=A0A1I7XWJ6_9BILA